MESISSQHGSRMTALVQLWLVIISIKSYLLDFSNFTTKSMAIMKNG
jgi:hypothetical protein